MTAKEVCSRGQHLSVT